MTHTIAPRKTRPSWQLGDLLTVGRTRWVIRRLDRSMGRVVLEAMNTTNHGEWWDTTLDRLPEKSA